MDLIYSQSRTLYDLIPHAGRPTSNIAWSPKGPHADGVIGYVNKMINLPSKWDKYLFKICNPQLAKQTSYLQILPKLQKSSQSKP